MELHCDVHLAAAHERSKVDAVGCNTDIGDRDGGAELDGHAGPLLRAHEELPLVRADGPAPGARVKGDLHLHARKLGQLGDLEEVKREGGVVKAALVDGDRGGDAADVHEREGLQGGFDKRTEEGARG